MNVSIQVLLSISNFIIAIAGTVGVILISTALFKIVHALKLRNEMLKQATRPYLYVKRNHQELEIHNNGQSPAVIDQIDSAVNFDQLKDQTLPIGQSFYYRIDGSKSIDLTIHYHDQIYTYSEHFKI